MKHFRVGGTNYKSLGTPGVQQAGHAVTASVNSMFASCCGYWYYGTTGGMHNRSENDRGARVAVWAHPTHAELHSFQVYFPESTI